MLLKPRQSFLENTKDSCNIRSRQSGSPSKQPQAGEKDQPEEDIREVRRKLSHYSPPPKEAKKNTNQAEETLKKVYSELKETEQTNESKVKDMGKGKGKEKEINPPVQEKEKGKETVVTQPHPIELHHAISEMGHDHQCDWKEKYITLQSEVDTQGQTDDIGLEGLTIVLHMKGRDDLVINTDLRNLE